ncbi:MAG TPA: hypothetical protein VEX38_00475, partial [Fimbriimonadaceae bacterium]|nr:hypothetical protein [Fimbriimonadaceae bacterium]
MAGKNPTQKEISEKYKSNFNYFDKGHYYRRLRGWLFALTAVLSVGAVLGFKYWGTDEFFSTGPISENHQRFAHDCKVCHEGAETDLLTLLPWKKASQTFSNAQNFSLTNLTDTASSVTGSAADGMSDTMEKLKMLVANVGEGDKLASMVDKALSYTSLSNIDRACLKCHDAMNLHQPQATLLRLRPISPEIALVHSGACSSCHREHIGH